jgi:hypothetical protein
LHYSFEKKILQVVLEEEKERRKQDKWRLSQKAAAS